MNLRSIGTCAAGAVIAFASTVPSHGQVNRNAQSSSASHVNAEMVKGKLDSAEGKPGDTVVLRLQSDIKANGEVVLKKGTMLTGVVRSVKRAETKVQPQAVMQIEWIVPAAGGNSASSISVALQSIRQVNPIQPAQENEIGGSTPTQMSNALTARHRSNPALLSMPSVMPVDSNTSSAIEAELGAESSGQLFKVGRGHWVNVSGSQQSVDIFSHLMNDTLITADGNDFEIFPGAQMRLLVGVNKN
jgi:hypothetical protein